MKNTEGCIGTNGHSCADGINANYHQVVEMTDEEKTKMYQKFSKAEIIKMLISANRLIVEMNNTGTIRYMPNKSIRNDTADGFSITTTTDGRATFTLSN